MPGVRPHPQPCAQNKKAHKLKSPQVRRSRRHSLHDGFTIYFAFSSETGLVDSVACSRRCKLDACVGASGRRDFTVCGTALRPAHNAPDAVRIPSHPAPNVRDDRDTPPFMERETREGLMVICPTAKAKNFGEGHWTSCGTQCRRDWDATMNIPSVDRHSARDVDLVCA